MRAERVQFLSAPRNKAFTLLEMLVAVTLLTLIVISLYGMFNQTQKAFRSSVKQVDVMESGRAATDLIARELGQVSASDLRFCTNLYAFQDLPNPLIQNLADGTPRTNRVQRTYYLQSINGLWNGLGYFLQSPTTSGPDTALLNSGIGTLFRVAVSDRTLTSNNVYNAFHSETNWQRIADGVVHFRLRAFDRNGTENPGGFSYTEEDLPAYLELELGIMEPSLVAQLRALPNDTVIRNFLLDGQAGKVHLFRQRIPVRTAL